MMMINKICGCSVIAGNNKITKYIKEKKLRRSIILFLKKLIVNFGFRYFPLPKVIRSRVLLYGKEISALKIFESRFISQC